MTAQPAGSIFAAALERPVWQTPIVPVTDQLWLHPKARALPLPYTNGMINLAEGGLLTIEGDQSCISHDDGATWEHHQLFASRGIKPGFEYGLVQSRSGVIVLVLLDVGTDSWKWDNEAHALVGEARRDTLCVRSFDAGHTWTEPVQIANFTGSIIQGLVTRDNHIVIPAQTFVRNPDHWAQQTLVSADDGASWTGSNLADVGGHGHHDGALEGVPIELTDGRVWMLLRTNLDRFYETFSEDHGLTWSKPMPTTITASSAPAAVQRLQSGRLVMAWNRLFPKGISEEGKAEFISGGDCNACQRASSWHRLELSIAFSEDDGRTWSIPVVVVRDRRMAYPTILEREAGRIWVTTRFSQRFALEIFERDFV